MNLRAHRVGSCSSHGASFWRAKQRATAGPRPRKSLRCVFRAPLGTKRNQVSIALLDDDSGTNLWRAEVETAGGGKEQAIALAPPRVAPVFWPEPLVDGLLMGAIDARESSYELVASDGGNAWDSLHVSIRKAAGNGAAAMGQGPE